MLSYDYKTDVHSNKDGRYGGPLCENPYGAEVSNIVKKLQEDAVNDKTMPFNNFTDPCPKLSSGQVSLMQGFDYADKTKPLPCGPLPWPAGLPHPGFVPKTNLLTGHYISLTGGKGEFVRITQRGDICTLDASVAQFARASRTIKSGHYFYEPLVCGSHLFGVWVTPEEGLLVGFFYDMTSGICCRIQRKAFWDSGYIFMRQSTEAFGKVSHIFFVKVSDDAGSENLPDLQSRDFTALAGSMNVTDNLGNPYPCEPLDLDTPVERDIWMDEYRANIESQSTSTIGSRIMSSL